MKPVADVVVIGAGVIGCSIAYHLARRGFGDVLLVEKGPLPGLGSTGRATGGFRSQFTARIDIEMSRASRAYFLEAAQATGVDPFYRESGYVFLATTDDQLAAAARRVAFQRQAGLGNVRLLDSAEVAGLLPGVHTADVRGASYCPTDGFIEPMRVLKGFLAGALGGGARLAVDTDVQGIRTAGDRVQAVLTNRGEISTRTVVIAAGAWSKGVAQLAGCDVPVVPVRRHVAGTLPPATVPDETPMVIDAGSGFHFRKDHHGGGGLLLLWANPDEPPGENEAFDPGWLAKVLPMAAARLPGFDRELISARRCWTGYYENTPDHHPILERLATPEGLYLACGFSGHGVMHSPVAGKLVAELILDGEGRSLDISQLSLSRFASGQLVEAAVL
jgi:sarcosine oxidase subunit beta